MFGVIVAGLEATTKIIKVVGIAKEVVNTASYIMTQFPTVNSVMVSRIYPTANYISIECHPGYGQRNPALVKRLIEERYFSDANYYINEIDQKTGVAPWHRIVKSGDLEAIEYLISLGISIELPVEVSVDEIIDEFDGKEKCQKEYVKGDTALLIAAKYCNIEVIKLLYECGADSKVMNAAKSNIVTYAAYNSHYASTIIPYASIIMNNNISFLDIKMPESKKYKINELSSEDVTYETIESESDQLEVIGKEKFEVIKLADLECSNIS